ncbi:hypothetical protein GCM10022393_12580 [Aquimarina addita]|uniref:F5/8 type C domain-containing protein n=1 Tax=Aquimarina addita TaxID=870485 RepID=A0ABP7XEE0_9FLAO
MKNSHTSLSGANYVSDTCTCTFLLKRIKKKTISFSLIIAALLISPQIFATDYTVNSADEFNDLSLSPGDVVTWENGNYSDQEINFSNGNGTASNPIILQAETPGGVIFGGSSTVLIAADYVIIDGFYWKDGEGANNHVQFRNGSSYANNSTIRNCAFNDLGESGTDKHRWIVLYGTNNIVENCSFFNKRSPGALILVELEYNDFNPVGHIIRNNYFYNYVARPDGETHAGDSETIRVGTSEYQDKSASVLVENNYFQEADGENEIITNKSANNTYKHNTFRNCHGSLVLRHGANAWVEGNFFLGENKEGSGGIRVTDSYHTIINNYMQGLNNADDIWNNGITLVGGSDASGGTGNGYQRVDDILVAFNTIYNADDPLFYNDRSSYDPTGVFAYNLVYSTNGTLVSGDISGTGQGMTYVGNIFGGSDLGLSDSGFTEADANFSASGEIFKPSSSGVAANAAGSSYNSVVGFDIEGRTRPGSNMDVGAHEISGGSGSVIYGPITDSQVGDIVGACFLDAYASPLSECGATNTNLLTVTAVSEFSAAAQSKSVSITSNVDWTVTDNQSWISITPTSGSNDGTISITTTENTSTSERNGTVTVSGGGISRTINITQTGQTITNPEDCTEGTNLSLSSSIDNYSTQENTTNTVTNILDENTSNRWSASGFPQYAVIDLGGEYDVNEINLAPYEDRAYQFIVEGSANSATSGFSTLIDATENTNGGSVINRSFDSQSVRYVKLTITGASGYDGSWSSIHSFEILCAGNTTTPDELTVSSVSDFNAEGQSRSVTITSNVDWTVTDNQSWISITPTSGSNDGTISITTTENTSTSERNGTVTVSGGGISRTINITQTGQTITNPEDCTEGTNLSLSSSIDNYSTQENTTNTVTNILDENTSNRWSASGFPQYAVIDLGGEYDVNEINLAPYEDRAYQFIVEGSANSATSGFSTLIDATENTNGGSVINRSFDSQSVRYVKLTITGASGYDGTWSSIHSFEVLCAGNTTTPDELTVSSVNDFDSKGTTLTAIISSNVAWQATNTASWISISPASGSNNGTISISALENTTTSERTATILVSGGGISRTIAITQQGASSISTECTEGTILSTNGDINDFSTEQNSTNGVANLIDGNTTDNRWSAENYPQYAVIDLGASYAVDQINLYPYESRAYQFLVEGSTTSADSGFSTLTDATDNASGSTVINKSFDTQNVRYIRLTVTGASDYTGSWISIREFEVICAGGSTPTTDILSVSSIGTFDSDDSSQTVNVTSNIDWTVAEDISWVSIDRTNGSNNGSFNISVSENTSVNSRTAIVTVNADGLSREINVSQNGTSSNTDLDPRLAPSENFDLSNWNINVPIDRGDGISTNISVVQLNNKYELMNVEGRDYFFTGPDGGMVFINYPKDAPKTSTRTSYTRTELRELLTGDSPSASNPANNWYFSSSDEIPEEAGGIDGVLTATLAVNHVTTDGNSNHKGRVIVGQIHASSNEPNRLYYHKLPEHDKGAIYVVHEDFSGDETYYNIIGNYIEDESDSGSLNDEITEPSDGIELNERFSYKIEVVGNDQWVTISRDGKDDVVKYINMDGSDYENDWMYFKAGVYSQNNTTDIDNDYDQATFYALNQSHGSIDKSINTDKNDNAYNIKIFPTQFNTDLTVTFSSSLEEIGSLKIIDLAGRIVAEDHQLKSGDKINIAGNLQAGMYMVQLRDSYGKILTSQKVIKSN